MLDRGIAIFGLALGLISWLWSLAPEGWPKMPPWLTLTGIGFGVLLFGFAAGLIVADRRNGNSNDDDDVQSINTSLRAQFYGDSRTPTEVATDNVKSWYALWSPSALVMFKDAGDNEVGRQVFPKSWNIFVLFEKPTKYRQLVVSFDSPGFPPYEVKQSGQTWAIVSVAGDIPAGVLQIYAKP